MNIELFLVFVIIHNVYWLHSILMIGIFIYFFSITFLEAHPFYHLLKVWN